MIDTIIVRPLWLLFAVGTFNTNTGIGGFKIVLWIITLFYSFVYHAFGASLLWRFYLSCFDINYSKQSENGQWKSLISPDCDTGDAKRNWFLRHIHNYGNFKWITIRMGVIVILLMIISYILWFHGYFNLKFR